jgi:hypothetical protein
MFQSAMLLRLQKSMGTRAAKLIANLKRDRAPYDLLQRARAEASAIGSRVISSRVPAPLPPRFARSPASGLRRRYH